MIVGISTKDVVCIEIALVKVESVMTEMVGVKLASEIAIASQSGTGVVVESVLVEGGVDRAAHVWAYVNPQSGRGRSKLA
mmetsp:Transcript_11658/g.24671  ORF Transcript_11658/g.24671 Transcript_11658/m.24671 type:complete len:80 (+) Transcript_11658:298-537(+)